VSLFKKRSQTPEPEPAAEPAPKPVGKGRPTPKRRDQQAKNLHPVVPKDRKAAKREARAARDEAWKRQSEAMVTGDEKYLPSREKGPVKRYIRDYVDARFSLGEFFMPLIFVLLILSFGFNHVLPQYPVISFYAVLATEELGSRVNTQNNAPAAQDAHIAQLGKDGAIQRALHLFHTSQQSGNWKMRRQAQNEWKYATRGMNEGTLLTAAQLAANHQFYEMSIHSADKTHNLLNYNLRYPTPFRELVTQYGNENGVDPAWVYGLIRQESRFVMGAQSSVGAQGLMQVMPATASMIARKIGMDNSELYTMNGNIRMGTWYMADARNSLSNSDVLATAGYNAGPGRARKWQGASMEGAIYAETIPFNETRDYVKKVLTNSVYYANILGEPKTSLKQRLGTIPAR